MRLRRFGFSHFVLTIFVLSGFRLSAATRYVAVTGSAGGEGTSPAQPWSLAMACNSAAPGDLILVQPGVYNGKYEIRVSGTESAPITFRADGALGSVVIDGTGVAGANDGLLFIRASNSKPLAQDLIVEGFELRNFIGVNDASGIRLLCTGSGRIQRIRFNRCYVHDIRGTNAMGITVYGQSSANAISGITLDNCEVAFCQPSPSEAVVFNGNIDGFAVTNCVIRNCNNIGLDMIGGESGFPPAPAAGKVARNGLVRACQVRNISNAQGISAAGIYVDGGRSITIENCVVESSDFGMEIGAENPGIVTDNVVVRNNILHRNKLNGLVVGGAESIYGRANNNRFYNNLFYENGTTDVYATELFIQYGSGNVFENNIIVPRADVLPSFLYLIGGNTNQTFRNNLWYTAGGTAGSEGDFGWIPEETNPSNPCCGDYQEFRSRTGQDAGGLYANPLFVNPTQSDYHLLPASPAINKGVVNADIAGGQVLDWDGFPRVRGGLPDIGPDEVWSVDAWWRFNFPGEALSPAGLAADRDGDCHANFMEYLAATSPKNAASQPTAGPLPWTGSGSPKGMFFEQTGGIDDAELQLWQSGDLSAWSWSGVQPGSTPITQGRFRKEWVLPAGTGDRVFLRLKAVLKP